MENIISTGKWLQIMAAQIDEKGFPKGCGQKLRNVAELFETHNAQVAALEDEATRLGLDLNKLEEHAQKLSNDLREVWRRYVSVCSFLERYDPTAALEFQQYKPFFIRQLEEDERRSE